MSEVFDVTPADDEPVQASSPSSGLPTPVEYLVSAAESHQIVMLGDRRCVAEHLAMLADAIGPLHSVGVDNLAWEFTNSRRQGDLDELTRAPVWDRRLAVELFVDLLGVGHGYEDYIAVLERVWEHNSGLADGEKPFRVVALGLPTYVEDPDLLDGRSAGETALRNWWMGGHYRDVSAWHMANTITAEVIRPGERAVVYCDTSRSNTHFVEWIDGAVSPGPGNILHNWMGEGITRVLFHGALDDDDGLSRMELLVAASPDPESEFGLATAASTLGSVRLHGLSGSLGTGQRSFDLEEVADGYLFVVPRSKWTRSKLIPDLLDPTSIEAAEQRYRALDPRDEPYTLDELEEIRVSGWHSIVSSWPSDPSISEDDDSPKKRRFRR